MTNKTFTMTLTGPEELIVPMVQEYAEAGGMADGKDPQTGQSTTPEEFGKKILGQHFLQMVMQRRNAKLQQQTLTDGAKIQTAVSVS